jgi:hypothetical protein
MRLSRARSTLERRRKLCPICSHDVVELRYVGRRWFVLNRESPDFEFEQFSPLEEDGRRVWDVVVVDDGG